MENVTFEQIKNLIDQKGGKYTINAFQDEQDIYYLYNDGWSYSEDYNYGRDELNTMQILESRTFDSIEQAISEIEKIGLPVNETDNLFKVEELKNFRENGEMISYAVFANLIPTWDELEKDYPDTDFTSPESLLNTIEYMTLNNAQTIFDLY